MPTDGWGPVLRMAEAFGLVALFAVPAGLLGWRLGRRAGPDCLPVPGTDNPAFTLAYLVGYLSYHVAVSVFGGGVAGWLAPPGDDRGVWQSAGGTLVVAPVLLVGWLWLRGPWRWRAAARAAALGVAGWLVVSPAVYGVNAAAEWASTAAGLPPRPHPLAAADLPTDPFAVSLLFAAVCGATAFAEEVLFRGLLVGALVRRPQLNLLPVGLAVAFAWMAPAGSPAQRPAVLWAVGLSAGLLALRTRPQAAAVWSTSVFFAAVHSNVWPTPVPLFLLGLVLGGCAVRTGGVLAGTVLHGLFNAVSLIYLVRG